MKPNYPELLKEYFNFCTLREQANTTKKLDLSNMEFIYPSELLPLISFVKANPKIDIIYPKNIGVQRYIKTMISSNIISASRKTYLPLVQLPNKRNEANFIIEELKHLSHQGKNLGGTSAFIYFLSEMIDNIYDHSQFRNAYVLAQRYPKMGFSEISIIDDGITIRGSYQKARYSFTDTESLLKAMEGVSAKDSERGFGLRTNASLFTKGLKGSFLIVSSTAALYVDKNDKKVFKFQKLQELRGTLISVHIPYPSKEVNIYDYVG